MPSQQGERNSRNGGGTKKLAGAGVAAGALSGVASAADGGSSWLFDPSQVGVEDATRFGAVDWAALRDHGDLLQVGLSDLQESWTADGTATTGGIVDDVDFQVGVPLGDAHTVVDASGVASADVDRVSKLGASQFGGDGHVGAVAVEGTFDAASVVDGFDQVTELSAVDGGDAYDRYRLSDDRLSGDVTIAVSDSQLLIGRATALEASGGDVVDLLVDARNGETARFGPESAHSGPVLDELSDMAAVVGAEWQYAADAHELVSTVLDEKLRAQGFLPEDVGLRDVARGVGAVAVGVDPGSSRAKVVVAYDRNPPAADVRSVVSTLEERNPSAFEDVEWSVEAGDDLLVVDLTTTADRVRSAQSGLESRLQDDAATLREGAVWGVLPTLKGAHEIARSHLSAFVEEYA